MEENNNVFSNENTYTTQEGLNESGEPQMAPEPTKQFVEPRFVAPLNVEKEPPRKENSQKGVKSVWVILIACGLSLIIGAMSGFVSAKLTNIFSTKDDGIINNVNGENAANTPINNVNINIDETAQNIVEAVAQKVTPSVVGIRTTTSVNSFFYGTQESSGEGSGVVYTSDGYIITNYHVVSGGSNSTTTKVEVFIDENSEKSYNATVVGYNIAADLAVIKIDANGLTPVEFADSDTLKVGQYVITVGNPGGLEFMDSVTYGVVSGLDRVVSTSDIELIQTDAAINPGNSGGALVNVKGQLVGINSAKIVSEEFEGMGFAIPSNKTKEICDNIIANENAPEPYVGITISERYTSSVLRSYGFPAGAVVSRVAEGSPAEKAGIERGDIITEFGGTKITEYTVLSDMIRQSEPNEKIKVRIYRNGRYYTTEVTIGANN